MRFFVGVAGIIYLLFTASLTFAKPVPVEHYSRTPAIFDAALSPDGRFLATVLDNGGKYILRVFNIADPSDKKIRASAYPKDIRINWVHWANNEQILVSTRQTKKIHKTIVNTGYLYVFDRNLTVSKLVLDPQLGVRRSSLSIGLRQFNNTVINFLPDEPEHILMSFGISNAFEPGVHKVNISTGSRERIERGTANIQHWITDLRGVVRVGVGRRDIAGDWQMEIKDASDGQWRSHKDYPGLTAGTGVYGFTSNPDEMIIGARDGKTHVGFLSMTLPRRSAPENYSNMINMM